MVKVEKQNDNKNDFGKLRINEIVNKVANDEITNTILDLCNALISALVFIYDHSIC